MPPTSTRVPEALTPPTREELAGIGGIEEFIRSICDFISPQNKTCKPANVAIIYRAFFEALKYEGLLCPRNKPQLTYQFRSQLYQIDLDGQFNGSEPVLRRKVKKRADVTLVRSRAFLLKVQAACKVQRAAFASVHRSEAEIDEELQALEKASPVNRITALLRAVERSEHHAGIASRKVNMAYYALGKGYWQMTKERLPTVPDICSITFHKLAFAHFMDLATRSCESAGVAGLKKRMERARKFVALVNLLSADILSLIDIINVVQIDRITFKMLITLQKDLTPLTLKTRARIEHLSNAPKILGKRNEPD